MSQTARDLYAHVEALFPICRSITGEGQRRTLDYIANRIPLDIHRVPSGTPVLDWEVPFEWQIRGGEIKTLSGQTIVDFSNNNLHIVQYSRPVDRVVPLDELQAHLHSLPHQSDLIPYRTAYYSDTWGFCLAHQDRMQLRDQAYQVRIDSALQPGSLDYGECFLPGEDAAEVLLSVHCCHPSLANDNLSGIAIAVELARALAARPHRFSYRFLFIPATIGAITWLHFNRDIGKRLRYGLVLTCLGDSAPPTYKCSRRGGTLIDRYAMYVLADEGCGNRVLPFIPYGYDERQYCSPGFDLPVGCLMRSPNGTFDEYHTSADNLDFVKAEALEDSLRVLERILDIGEKDVVPRNLYPYGEPQLGRRGLYRAIGGQHGADRSAVDQMSLLWVLNLADGTNSLLDIAARSGKPFEAIAAAADALREAGLVTSEEMSA